MATAVVSGRVDEEVYRRANAVIQRAGKTPGEVIKGVWSSIATTGRIPPTEEEEAHRASQRERFEHFLEFLDSLPPAPQELIDMTDEDMHRLFGERDV